MKCIRRPKSVLSSLKVMLPHLLTSKWDNFTASPTSLWGIGMLMHRTVFWYSQPVSDQRTDALSPGYFHPSILATLHALQLPSSQYQGRSQGLLWGQWVCHIPKDTSVPTLQQGAKPAAGVWACSITLPVAVVWCLSLSNSQELGCQCVNQSFHQAVFPPGARKSPSELQSCEACP